MLVNTWPLSFMGKRGIWTPADLGSTLKGWYVTDLETESDGTDIFTLTDRSGNGFDYTYPGVANTGGPVMRFNRVNGHKAMEFGDSGTVRHLSASSSLLNGATSASMFMVIKCYADPTTSPADLAAVQSFTTAASPNAHFFSDSNLYESFGSNTRRNLNPTPSWAAWRIYHVHSASNDYAMWFDGSTILTSGTNTVALGTGTRHLGYLGSGTGYYRGDLAEFFFCDSKLSTLNRQKAEGYLAHRYGLAGNLPAGHPYLGSPP